MLEREDDINEVVDGLGVALGVDDIHADVHHRETSPGCAAILRLDEDDAWYERNTFQLAGYPDGPDVLYDRTVAHFVDGGFEVDELLAPLSGSRGLRAIRGDLGVLISFVGAGANLTVTAGPCGVDLSPVHDAYEVVSTSP